MDIPALWAEMEAEYSWRIDEIRFFHNQIQKLTNTQERDQYRRALVLLLYAHYEGFCKFAFTFYVNAINKENILCKEANYAIAAASLEDLFGALRHPEKKCPEFKNQLPDDIKLHIFSRNREFVERSKEFENRPVSIPDQVVDMESNLKPVVLRKNLFKLGFPHDGLQHIESDISQLLANRNSIAHGTSRHAISLKLYQDLQKAAWNVMATVKSYVMQALQNREFLRT
ncbi:MAE_28990/MAE_18760 family HEPN-like nuclease [Paraflavitalea sp. CAU 1676]|uniref:MAE_28990/MAE_18760 family HEPN-like nuclease n=1 Tax=Paraflavitalea sp. CAU 1676 TaxID=3032598 RepID=UPI0023DC8BB0|nr:MAE_28990/MAE_18760 family HEPN-like nuclease [Paraflavitalea sp. CAU 1676]MDF2190317.1 MAE_28990/MAE_18760 family HEPN-like nuclease [Paraflavitalea sp. CAU 1676]